MSTLAAASDSEDVADIPALIQTLTIEKRPLRAQLDGYKYPILTLPTEIVSEIFIHLLLPYPMRSKLKLPTILGRVCRKWREIARSTPALWRAITVWPRVYILNIEDQVRMLKCG
jgi:hypothetical protein